jgi:hypothetical protein
MTRSFPGPSLDRWPQAHHRIEVDQRQACGDKKC